jgi:hypothetical protein
MSNEVLGEEEYGADWEGDDFTTVGAGMRIPPRQGAKSIARPMLQLPPRPAWRNAVAPGVPQPGQGLEPLPLTGNPTPTFTAAIAAVTFDARPQRPFRAERLLVSVRRAGASAAGLSVVTSGVFIGTNLQQAELGNMDIEFFGPTAFGVRLNLVSAVPGMLIRLPLTLQGGVLAGADTITVVMTFLGRTIR